MGTGVGHAFVVFSRPFDGVAAVPGRDLSQVPDAAEALRVARDSGEFTVSRAYVLLKDRQLPAGQQQLSFTLVVPVNDHAGGHFRGWVVMGLRGGDFLNETLRSHARSAVRVLAGARNRAMTQVDEATAALRQDIERRQETGEQLAGPADVQVTAARIVQAMEQPFHVGGEPAVISASVGIALSGAGDADAILKEADEAMYLAKTAGKNRYVLAE